mgnify:CR=1 FL=1
MTILICIPCLLTGGTEIQTLNLVRALVSGGHRVVVACYFEYSETMVGRYRAEGAEVELMQPEGKRIGGLRGLWFLYKGLRRLVKKYRPAVVHVQYMAPGAQPCLFLKLLGVPHIIATAHTDARIYSSLRLLHFIQRHVVDVFTCITTRAEKEFFGTAKLFTKETGLAKHDHVTIYNSLPEHVALADGARSHLPGQPVIGMVSRMEHIKGVDMVIPAFAEVLKQCPQAHLLVVGDGSLLPGMKDQAAAMGVADKVEWAGRQAQEKLSTHYDRIDVFWMPSRSEGFGLSALEAMARGCPVVASRVGGLPELVTDNCGLLCEPESAASLAEATCCVLQEEEAYVRLSQGALKRAREFSTSRYTELMLSIYDKVRCLR